MLKISFVRQLFILPTVGNLNVQRFFYSIANFTNVQCNVNLFDWWDMPRTEMCLYQRLYWYIYWDRQHMPMYFGIEICKQRTKIWFTIRRPSMLLPLMILMSIKCMLANMFSLRVCIFHSSLYTFLFPSLAISSCYTNMYIWTHPLLLFLP